jgi:type I restriction enzyme, S subunit
MAADSGRKYFTTTAIKTTNLASTNKTKLGNFPILIPPIDEQLQLIEYSKSIDREYDNAISTVSNEVERLNELRHILISSAVTGKIKV